MGRNIMGVSQVQFVHQDECCEERGHTNLANIDPDYTGFLDGLRLGCYTAAGEKKVFGGDWESLEQWAELLSYAVHGTRPETFWGDEAQQGQAFAEVIAFATMQGYEVIGPLTSRKLAADFAAYEGEIEGKLRQVIARRDLNRWFNESDISAWLVWYQDWKKAFELASDGGFVYLSG